jgi:hypothetical protein
VRSALNFAQNIKASVLIMNGWPHGPDPGSTPRKRNLLPRRRGSCNYLSLVRSSDSRWRSGQGGRSIHR